jgi:hypothetical protein
MLRIALIGAPTAGKTELAQRLKSALNERKVAVVDDYIREVERRSNVVLSHYASYIGNVQAAIGRFEAERLADSGEPDVVVTCGTLVENAIYVATLAFTTHSNAGDAPYRMANDARANLTMTWLGVLKHDLWNYDLVYYLPLVSNDRWNSVVDDHIPEAAEQMGVSYIELKANDLEFNVSLILQEILALETTPPNESPSGDSDREVEEVRLTPGHVPDLPEQT